MPISRLLHHLYTEDEFVFSVLTSGAGQTFSLPLEATGTYSFNVTWGDGSKDSISAWDDAAKTHTYTNAGTYTIVISGVITGWRFAGGGDDTKMRNIFNWGPLNLGNNNGYFYGCQSMTVTATDILDLTGTTNLSNAFRWCFVMTTIPSIDDWDVSSVTNMYAMFERAYVFNQDLNSWNTGAVTNMRSLFGGSSSGGAKLFNGNISSWDTSNVTNMSYMFQDAQAFNGDISGWDVSSVTTMHRMFDDTLAFNQPLNSWNVSSLNDAEYMFHKALAFNQPLNSWNVSNVTLMSRMFEGAAVFNQDLNSWNTGAVTDMSYMFNMFSAASPVFNGNISSWDVSSVTSMANMFYASTAFNGDISGWTPSSCLDMSRMFDTATLFDKDIGSWNVTSLLTAANMFYGATLSTANYDALLIGWEAQAVQNDVHFHGGSSKYSAGAAAAARAALIADHSWVFQDGGPV